MGFSGLVISLRLSGSGPVSDVLRRAGVAEGAGWDGQVPGETVVLEMAPMHPYWHTGRARWPGHPPGRVLGVSVCEKVEVKEATCCSYLRGGDCMGWEGLLSPVWGCR